MMTLQDLKLYGAGFLLASLVLGAVTLTISQAAQQLDRATARQCATLDWPSNQHQDHVEFCMAYGYAVGTNYPTGEYTGH